MTFPTYEQLYAHVLDKVQHTAIGDRPSDQQHEHTQDIMDALAEAYDIGYLNGCKYVSKMVLSDGMPELLPNPYKKKVVLDDFL